MSDKTCRGCEHLKQVCGIAEPFVDAGECNCFAKKPKNLFDRITTSPEVLAEKLVWSREFFWCDEWGNEESEVKYFSTITDEMYSTKSEAIKATLAELDKPSKKEDNK